MNHRIHRLQFSLTRVGLPSSTPETRLIVEQLGLLFKRTRILLPAAHWLLTIPPPWPPQRMLPAGNPPHPSALCGPRPGHWRRPPLGSKLLRHRVGHPPRHRRAGNRPPPRALQLSAARRHRCCCCCRRRTGGRSRPRVGSAKRAAGATAAAAGVAWIHKCCRCSRVGEVSLTVLVLNNHLLSILALSSKIASAT